MTEPNRLVRVPTLSDVAEDAYVDKPTGYVASSRQADLVAVWEAVAAVREVG